MNTHKVALILIEPSDITWELQWELLLHHFLIDPHRASPAWQQYPRIVPTGTRLIQSQLDKAQLVSTNARRLEVLKNCISFIFDNKISDARKASGS